MTLPTERVVVQGLDELRKGLRQIDPSLGKLMGQVNQRAGASIVAHARSLYGDFYHVRRGRVPNSIRALAQQRKGVIRMGVARVPYAGGQEFGSNRFKQFAPYTNGRGRFLYPALREEIPQLRERYTDIIFQAMKELEVIDG